MGKYILFAATKRDCGCRFWRPGDWCATKYVLYSDGTCYRIMEYVEKPQQTMIFRMDAEKLEQLRELLETQFDGVRIDRGCDGTQWEMHHYAAGGRCLYSTGRGFVEHVPVLNEIRGFLECAQNLH